MTEAASERRQRFDHLFETYSSDVLAYCSWRVGSPADAQDAASEVFLVAWRRLDEIPEGDAARVWLYATARRVVANQRRSGRRRLALRERLTHEAWSQPRESMPFDHEQALVHEALGRLSTGDRETLLLSEWEGLAPAEIAEVLGCLTVTARSRLHRARRRFRAAYEELQASRPVARADAQPRRYSVQFRP